MECNDMSWIAIITGLAGLLAGLGLWQIFRRLPTEWLLEYGETIIPDELLVAQRSRIWPDAVTMMVAGALLAGFGWARFGLSIDIILFGLSAATLLLILIADWKTRIIPDPLTLLLAVLAVVTMVVQFVTGPQSWLSLLWRLAAGIAAGAFFLLIGWVGSRLAGQDAMGMGDVKLIVVCVWLVDYPNTIALIFLSFITASFFAFPLLIQKYWPRRRTRSNGQDEVDGMLAFGPFIAVATLLVMLVKPELAAIWQFYLGQF
jgi:prepilin signal peptidase PulO-like enzyme (type II secretory pathway)